MLSQYLDYLDSASSDDLNDYIADEKKAEAGFNEFVEDQYQPENDPRNDGPKGFEEWDYAQVKETCESILANRP